MQAGQFQATGLDASLSKLNINITADNNFTLYDSPIGSKTIGSLVFNIALDYLPNRLFVEAVDDGQGTKRIAFAVSKFETQTAKKVGNAWQMNINPNVPDVPNDHCH